ncbi:hypothetical protein GOP47_0012953 [Adiantum capillus-veneris]|uniref:Protein GPR107 n=1 Tax=Adiantum capillus-veneris TaxID=13818 RepID=A0A9D4ZG66_ADICA|nr:hypothetical protein GOP47_0012953 [Adiantum capillus-veneris]
MQHLADHSKSRSMASCLGGCATWVPFLMLFVWFTCIPNATAGIHHQSIKDDNRMVIVLEQFGSTSRGHLDLELSNVEWSNAGDNAPLSLNSMGFFTVTEDDWLQVIREYEQKSIKCILESRAVQLLFTFAKFSGTGPYHYNHTYPFPRANRYLVMFNNCLGLRVSMSVRASMYNMEGHTKDYLSEGQTQLPLLFFCFFWVYVALAGIWTYVCIKQKITAHRIHILMGILVALKAFYMFSEAEDKFYVKKTGTPHGWDVAFYAFSFLKGVMLFVVIVLIGTGWSFLKPYLQGKEKKVLMVVIPLQVLANIATIVIGESGLSDRNWLTWYQLLLLIDVICCCAVLFPIVWSIKHLREAAHTDGKAARNLAKLTLFRQYYIVVVSYIYFTRIVVSVLQTVTSYHYMWVSELARELATLSFYVFTGYKFRPIPHNPYFVLDEEEEEVAVEEMLKDDDFEL